MSRVRVGQQQQQQGQRRRQQLPARVAQRSAKHGPLSEEAQLVRNLQEQRGTRLARIAAFHRIKVGKKKAIHKFRE